jgi:hypothetical protein
MAKAPKDIHVIQAKNDAGEHKDMWKFEEPGEAQGKLKELQVNFPNHEYQLVQRRNDVMPASKPAAKTAAKPAAKAAPKAAVKPAVKPVAKPAAKPMAKAPAKKK